MAARSRFYEPSRHKSICVLKTLAALPLPLLKRKTLLRKAVFAHSTVVQLVDHVLGEGKALFETACALDLEQWRS